jgi:hypothetical protein
MMENFSWSITGPFCNNEVVSKQITCKALDSIKQHPTTHRLQYLTPYMHLIILLPLIG